MSVAFDTLKAVHRLSAAGFSQEQAESLAATFAEGITENLATKDDLELVRKDIKALNTRIDTSIAALDARIDTYIDKLRSDMTIRLGGIVLGGITALKLIENFLAN